MKVTERTPVGDIVAKYPRAARIFESHRVDYCCGGERPLHEACATAGVSPATILGELLDTTTEAPSDRDWTLASLSDLIAHLVSVHHAYLRAELPVLDAQLRKVLLAHGARHGESLTPLSRAFEKLRRELELHLEKEERVLFPGIQRCEQAALGRADARSAGVCRLHEPIEMMEQEHESAGQALRLMRRLTGDYEVPADGCATYRALYEGLIRLETDLHLHIHLENNVLFPRTIGLGGAIG